MSVLKELKLEEEKTLAIRVRALCQLYSGSAEIVGSGKYSDDEEIREYEKQRYEKGRKEVSIIVEWRRGWPSIPA